MNEAKYIEGCQTIINHYGYEHQLNKLVEECAELIRAISKNEKQNILEEIADVKVLINQLEIFSDYDEAAISVIQTEKVKRQLDRIAYEQE